jgi:flavin reductase (DIM6/NTAB) family NADH-FMN oxidoreductase RutF
MKREVPPASFLYPMPAALVGAMVDGRPNFCVIAFCGIVNLAPPTISVAMNQSHYTNRGIHANQAFSVNVPSAAMVEVVDWCGMYSGRREDKSQVFEVFYGKLGVPLAQAAPVNLECRVIQHLDTKPDEVFIGEIVAVHVNDECFTDDTPDLSKIDPLVFSMSEKKYYRVGAEIGPAWSIGKNYRKG